MARLKLSCTDPPGNPQHWFAVDPSVPRPIIYLSGNTPYVQLTQDMIKHGLKHYCFSYAYCDLSSPDGMKVIAENFRLCREAGVRIFLDSGAFTFQVKPWRATESTLDAWRAGYYACVRQHQKHLDFYAVLDYLQCGKVVQEEVEKMRAAKLSPTPAFHITTPLDMLRRYADLGYKLIGVGSALKSSSREQARFYNAVFNLGEKLGLLFHGFAVTGRHMFDYPWYSVDSATWLKVAINGGVVFIDPVRKRVHNSYITNGRLSPQVAERLRALKFNPKQLAKDFQLRALFNMVQFLKLEVREDLRKDHHRWQTII